jgi:heparan-alpha-glucosaminide N-acetyltransferase
MSTITMKDPGILSRTEGAQRVHVASIDILRAVTMILMIFVNDLWSLKGIPAWLGHVDQGVDGIGLADVVFPAFLFIVGLSLPYAINNRRKKRDTDAQLIGHVLLRTVALLVMGVFLVNGESINAAATGMPRLLWNAICCTCFILIWNTYPTSLNKLVVYGVRVAAMLTLLILASQYRGGPDEAIRYFGPQWWGILGLIGWAYLASGLVTIFAKNNFYGILGGWIFFAVLSMIYHAGFVPQVLNFIPNAILGGTLAGLTMGGVVTSMIFQHYRLKGDNKTLTIVLIAISLLLVFLSAITRPYWGLAKLGATPAWLFLCSALTILGFLVVYWIADVYKKAHWFNVIKAAGTATLLCYLIPYFAYGFTRLVGFHPPEMFLTGGLGLLKSFLFAILCAQITGLLIRSGIRLKL